MVRIPAYQLQTKWPFFAAALSMLLIDATSGNWTRSTFWLAAGLTVILGAMIVRYPANHILGRIVPPFAYLLVVAFLRHSGGGVVSGFGALVMLPVLWVALYGDRRELLWMLAGVALVFFVPILTLSDAMYPDADIRRGIVSVLIGGLVGIAVQNLVQREREHSSRQAQQTRNLRQAQELLQTQYTASRILEQQGARDETIREVFQLLGEKFVFSAIIYWEPDPQQRYLHAAFGWGDDGLQDCCATIHLASGADVPGRAWRDNQTEFANGFIDHPERFERGAQAAEHGISSSLSVPLGHDGAGQGVIEFLSTSPQRPESEIINTLEAIVGQLSQFIARKDAKEEAERLKDEFFSLVSHELRTPLTSIMGYLDILQEDVSDEHDHFLQRMDFNARRLLRLVDDLLFTTQIEKGSFTLERVHQVDLGEILQDVINTLEHRAIRQEITLHTEVLPAVADSIDRDRIAQAYTNVLANALKYTPDGGEVRVRTAIIGDEYVVRIEDTGIGVPAGDQPLLFQRFQRASNALKQEVPGVGLGLSIVRAIVEGHDGSIALESEENKGAHFIIRLPMGAS